MTEPVLDRMCRPRRAAERARRDLPLLLPTGLHSHAQQRFRIGRTHVDPSSGRDQLPAVGTVGLDTREALFERLHQRTQPPMLVRHLAELTVEARQARGQRGDGVAGFGHALQQKRHGGITVAAEVYGGKMMAPLDPSPPITAFIACIISTTLASPTGVR